MIGRAIFAAFGAGIAAGVTPAIVVSFPAAALGGLEGALLMAMVVLTFAIPIALLHALLLGLPAYLLLARRVEIGGWRAAAGGFAVGALPAPMIVLWTYPIGEFASTAELLRAPIVPGLCGIVGGLVFRRLLPRAAEEEAGAWARGDTGMNVIVFDAQCLLCSANARFVLRHDRRGHFRLASMQSEAGAALYRRFGIDPADPETMIVVTGDTALRDSDAVIAVWRGLGWPWRALGVLGLAPRPLRDAAYRRVARNRYRLFGRREACWLPTPEQRERML